MNKRKSLAILLFVLLNVTICYSQTAAEALDIHRQWMAKNYPRADTLSESALFKETAISVAFHYREPEARNLLKAVAQKSVLRLNDYIAWLDSGLPDYEFEASINATEAIANAAEEKFGKYDNVTAWCRYLSLDVKSNTQDVVKELKQAILDQSKAISLHPTREAKSLLCIMKFLLFTAKQWNGNVDDPKDYDDLFKTEEEVLSMYSINDTLPDLTRAMLYLTIADAKQTASDNIEYRRAQSKSSICNYSFFTPVSQGYLDNILFYYDNVIGNLSQLYGEWNPILLIVYSKKMAYLRDTQPIEGESMTADAERLYDYASLYSPKGSDVNIQLKLAKLIIKYFVGEQIGVAGNMPLLEESKQMYGENSESHLSVVQWLTIMAASESYTDLAGLLDYCVSLMETIYSTDPLKLAFEKYTVFSAIKYYVPDRSSSEISSIYNIFKTQHRADPLSIYLGRRLVEYLWNIQSAEIVDVQNCVSEDVKEYFGNTSDSYFTEEKNKIVYTYFIDQNAPRGMYKNLIDKMENCGADYQWVLDSYAEYEYTVFNYDEAEKLYRKLIKMEKEEDIPCYRATHRLYLLNVMANNHERDKETMAKLYSEAKKLMECGQDTINYDVYNYELAADYLVNIGEYKSALEMLENGMVVNDIQTNSSFDDRYISMLIKKINTLYYSLNDKVAAKRLMDEYYKKFNMDSNNMSYSRSALDFLWTCYDILSSENSQDIEMGYYYINLIMKITQNYISREENSTTFTLKETLLVPVLGVVVDIMCTTKSFMKEIKAEELSEQKKIEYEQNKNNLKILVSQCVDALKEIEKEYPSHYNNYKENNNYQRIIQNLILCYRYLIPNHMQVISYLNKYIETQTNPKGQFYAYLDFANFYLAEGNLPSAQMFYSKAQLNMSKIEGKTVEDDLCLVANYIELYAKMKDYDKLLEQARLRYNYIKEIMEGNFQLMTEREQNNFMQKYNDPAGTLCYVLSKKPEIAGEVYDAVLYRTGMQLRSLRATKNAIRQSDDNNLIRLLDSLRIIQETAAKINIKNYNEQQQEALQLQAMKIRINNLEQQIIQKSEPYRLQNSSNVTWRQIRSTLKDDEAAVEYVFSDNEIMALLLRKDYDAPLAISLSNADSLRLKFSNLNVTRTDKLAKKLYSDNSIDLYAMLWQPIEAHLQGIKTVYYTTPGILNNLSFAAFTTPDGAYLFDKYDLCQLTTTAVLLRQSREEKPSSAVLMGSIFYSNRQSDLVKSGMYKSRGDNEDEDRSFADFPDTAMRDNRGTAHEHFGYLEHSYEEIKEIEDNLREKGVESSNIKVSKENEATESTFRQMINAQPSVIHLATHGFFIANVDKAYEIPFYKNHRQYISNSMRRAGVALAGAEATWCGSEADDNKDGILTAEEVSRLNLQNTQLVTLSACETALGDFSFEGIYGLPRGFKQAGVRSLLVSLWSVNDESTAMLMSEFYSRWLSGDTMRQALHESIKAVRQRFPQPYFWAPFVLLDAN